MAGEILAVTLDIYRRLQAAASGGFDELKPAAFMAFGDGAHHADGSLKPFSSELEALNHHIVTLPLTERSLPDLYKLRAKCVLNGSNVERLDEAILLDADMRPMSMAVFPLKNTAPGETYSVTLLMHF